MLGAVASSGQIHLKLNPDNFLACLSEKSAFFALEIATGGTRADVERRRRREECHELVPGWRRGVFPRRHVSAVAEIDICVVTIRIS